VAGRFSANSAPTFPPAARDNPIAAAVPSRTPQPGDGLPANADMACGAGQRDK